MLPALREVVYVSEIPKSGLFLLAGDIGGTNTNIGIFDITKRPVLLFSLHARSKEILDYAEFFAQLCPYIKQKFGIELFVACLGAAGIISENRTIAHPTNLKVIINARTIQEKAGLQQVVLINDFEAVGLGIELLPPESLITIHEGVSHPKAHKGALGAGTGLGKAALLWHRAHNRYIPFASEGGHADAVIKTAEEFALFDFIRAQKDHCGGPVSWEDILSGNGIQRIYNFLGTIQKYPITPYTHEIEKNKFPPDFISRYAHHDMRCKDTLIIYATLYARCTKSFVLDTLALGGVYIAGGIAAKNIQLFKNPIFMKEFLMCGKHESVLAKIPIIVIGDYNVSLYGAMNFMHLYNQGIL